MVRPTPAPFVLELLEPRLAPAGVVTVSLSASGVLTLAGDGLDNQVTVSANEDGSWSLRDLSQDGSDTTFRYKGQETAELTFTSPLRSIQANLKAGADELTLQGLTLAGSVVLGDTAEAAADIFTFLGNTIQGPVKISTGGGEDVVRMQGNHLAGRLSIHTGAGADTIALHEGLYGSISANLGGSVGGDFESFSMMSNEANITVRGNVSVRFTGKAEGSAAFHAPALSIQGNLQVHSDQYNSYVSVGVQGTGTVPGTGTVFIGGNLVHAGSSGYKELKLQSSGDFTVGGDLIYQAGKMYNQFRAVVGEDLTLGDVKLHAGQGVLIATMRADTATLDSLSLRGSARYSGLSLSGGDYLIKGNVNIDSPIALNRNDAETGLQNEAIFSIISDTLQIGGSLNVTSSTPSLDLTTRVTLKASSGSLGHIRLQGGSSYEYFTLESTTVGGLQVNGDVNLRYGSGVGDQTKIIGAIIHGDLAIRGGMTRAGEGRDVEIKSTTIHDRTSILQQDRAPATIHIQGSTFHGRLDVNTGGGDDYISLSAANNYGTPIDNVFHQAVNIRLGSGTDHINLDHRAYAGQDSYLGSLRVHGGSGSDTLVLNEGVNLFAIPPVWTSIESITPAG